MIQYQFIHPKENVIEHKRRIYLTKDTSLQAKNIKKMYTKLNKFKQFIQQTKYSSNLAERLKL